jgi:quercetin dioxygenase-like cupin family protein
MRLSQTAYKLYRHEKEKFMDIRSPDALPTKHAPAEYFTGTVWQEPLVEAPPPARLRAVQVRFDPGARTNWHTHPLGQTLYVLTGLGLIQREGQPAHVIRPGYVVWIPPGEKHWHGAAPDHAMTHLAMHEALDGANVTWLEPVSAAQYENAARTAQH